MSGVTKSVAARCRGTSLVLAIALAALPAALAVAQESTPSPVQPPPAAKAPAWVAPALREAGADIEQLVQARNYAGAERRALDLRELAVAAYGPESAEALHAQLLLVYASIRPAADTTPAIVEVARDAASEAGRLLGDGSLERGVALGLLGSAQQRVEQWQAARESSLQSVDILASLPASEARDRELARSYRILGSTETRLGNHAAGLSANRSALTIIEGLVPADDLGLEPYLRSLAWSLYWHADYAGALAQFERSLAILERHFGTQHPRLMLVVTGIGSVHYSLGDAEAALRAYRQAVSLGEGASATEVEAARFADALNSLGHLELQMGNAAAARVYLERALPLYADGEKDGRATLFQNLSWALADLGENEGAIEAGQQSLALRTETLGASHWRVGASHNTLGSLLMSDRRFLEAGDHFERAVETAASLGLDHPYRASALYNLALSRAHGGMPAEALASALEAQRILTARSRVMAQALSERQALDYASLRVRRESLSLGVSLALAHAETLPGAARALLAALVSTRGLVIDELAASRLALSRTGDPEVSRLIGELAELRSQLAGATLGVTAEGGAAARAELRRQIERAEAGLAERSVAFRDLNAERRVGLEQVAAALPAASALVAYVQYDSAPLGEYGRDWEPSFAAFVLLDGGRGPVVLQRLGPAEHIESLVEQWRRAMASPAEAGGHGLGRMERNYRRVGAELRAAIWDPVAPLVASAERVFLVPDGVLHLVSFDALPTDEGRYLAETAPLLHYLAAERELASRPPEAPGSGLLAIGDPVFDRPAATLSANAGAAQPLARSAPSSCKNFRSLHFEPLVHAGAELAGIAEMWQPPAPDSSVEPVAEGWQVRRLMGEEATERAFKEQAGGHRVIHVASHGFFFGGRCASLLEPGEDPESEGAYESPMLLSGLVFAGANLRDSDGDDGFLTAEEISALDLTGVEWAVLSACDTGLGDIRGDEGVFGLRRAFRVAGARTLVMSLWQVDDTSTAQWMRFLYEGRLRDGLDTPSAMRRANLSLLAARRASGDSSHPFFWGAFVASGDWR